MNKSSTWVWLLLSARHAVLPALTLALICLANIGPAHDYSGLGEDLARADIVVNPARYQSASGTYEFFVEPSEKDGNGPAKYRLVCNGKDVWADERPFTLWQAAVTDTGTVVGYSYEGGVTGGFKGEPEIGVVSTRTHAGLHAYIFGADGKRILRDRIAATRSRNNAGTDSEAVSGILVDAVSDRFLVQFHHSMFNSPPLWVSYGLTTGDKLGSFHVAIPKHKDYDYLQVMRTELIPGTPLVVIHWSALSRSGGGVAGTAALSVVTLEGEEVWSMFLPGEYAALNERGRERWQQNHGLWKQLTFDQRAFSFSSIGLTANLSFSVVQTSGSSQEWSVVRTKSDVDPQIAESVSKVDEEQRSLELEFLGYIELGWADHKEQQVPFSIVDNFRIDEEGNLGFVSPNRDGSVQFVRVDSEGKILSNFDLDLPVQDAESSPLILPTSKDRWLVVFRSWYTDPFSKAWWLTPSTQKLIPIPSFHNGRTIDLDRTGDGGFVTASHVNVWNGNACLIQRYDRLGAKLWESSLCHLGLWSPLKLIDVTWQEQGGAVALSRGYEAQLIFIDPDGELKRAVPVTDIIEKELHWPTGLSADTNGGLIFNDMGAPPTFRINAADEVIATTRPRFKDDQILKMTDDVQVAPDGALWTSDGYALLRLDETGVVDKVIGRQSREKDSLSIGQLSVASSGEIYVTHGESWSVHVYDTEGKFLRKYDPLDGPSEEVRYFRFAPSPDGGAVRIETSDSKVYELSKSGELRELQLPAKTDPKSKRVAKPGSEDYWMIDKKQVTLVDFKGTVKKMIEKRPNGHWMETIFSHSVARDGSLALLVRNDSSLYRRGVTLCIYDSNGEPLQTSELNHDSKYSDLSLCANFAVTMNDGVLRFYDRKSGEQMHWGFPTSHKRRVLQKIYLSPDGTEFWFRQRDSMSLRRYRIPQ